MCEDCENPTAQHLTFAEKRKRINTVWQPVRRPCRPFTATSIGSRVAQSEFKPAFGRTD